MLNRLLSQVLTDFLHFLFHFIFLFLSFPPVVSPFAGKRKELGVGEKILLNNTTACTMYFMLICCDDTSSDRNQTGLEDSYPSRFAELKHLRV